MFVFQMPAEFGPQNSAKYMGWTDYRICCTVIALTFYRWNILIFLKQLPCWRYTVAIWRKLWRNTKRHLHKISLLFLSALFFDWLIIFEFGFTEFIHCWLINTENLDNGWPLKVIFGMNYQLNMHTSWRLKVILGSHCIVYISVRIII